MDFLRLLSAGPTIGEPLPRKVFEGGAGWINSRPLTERDLRGRVVLVDFFDYTCINCIRTFPYLTAWHERYAKHGLLIVGIHSPEFAFAKSRDALIAGLHDHKITYPVVMDNAFVIWQRFSNHVWPHHYLVDHEGIIREEHQGEGGYAETETMIQDLLAPLVDSGVAAAFPEVIRPVRATDAPGAVCHPVTPELYCGHERGRFGNREGVRPDVSTAYKAPVEDWPMDVLVLHGVWRVNAEESSFGLPKNIHQEFAGLRFTATELYLVMAPKTPGVASRWDIRLDGKPLTRNMAGDDVQFEGETAFVSVSEGKMYRLIKAEHHGVHAIRLIPRDDRSAIYAFTFGSSCV